MSLTLGSGPLSRRRTGTFNFDIDAASPAHVLYLEPVLPRVRAVVAGETVVDTQRAVRLHESGLLPQWYLPAADVRQDLLTPTSTSTHCPFKGDASYWALTVGDRVIDDACWGYPTPLPTAPPMLAGLVAFYADKIDEWYEEDQRLLGHARDPYHRVDTRPSSRHVEVRVAGELVAQTDRPLAVFETGLPPRWYVPRADVTAPLEDSPTTSICPYKGVAAYHGVRVSGRVVPDAAWSYPEPHGEALAARDHVCFWGEETTVTVNGEPAP